MREEEDEDERGRERQRNGKTENDAVNMAKERTTQRHLLEDFFFLILSR